MNLSPKNVYLQFRLPISIPILDRISRNVETDQRSQWHWWLFNSPEFLHSHQLPFFQLDMPNSEVSYWGTLLPIFPFFLSHSLYIWSFCRYFRRDLGWGLWRCQSRDETDQSKNICRPGYHNIWRVVLIKQIVNN